jgi:DNA ligase (NAD+)
MKKPSVKPSPRATHAEELAAELRDHDKRYAKGRPIISDEEYDDLRAALRAFSPAHKYFTEQVAEAGEKDLPADMPSLVKIRPDSALAWVKDARGEDPSELFAQAEEKIDGISCLLHYKDGVLFDAFKKNRASGKGRSILQFVKRLNTVPGKLEWKYAKNFKTPPISLKGDLLIRGELAISYEAFESFRKSEYKTPRSLVAGIFNRDEVDKQTIQDLQAVDFIACDVVFPLVAKVETKQYILLGLFPTPVFAVHLPENKLAEVYIIQQFHKAKNESPYPCDGIVLKTSDGMAIHSIAVKLHTADQPAHKTVVNKVEWTMSARNLAKPVVIVEPVVIEGVKITRLTGNNARTMHERKIGPGSTVHVVHAGNVIPHLLAGNTQTDAKLLPTPSPKYKPLQKCPDCGSTLQWTRTATGAEGADLKCYDAACLSGKLTATFLTRIGIKGLGDKTIADVALDRSVRDVLEMSKADFVKELGAIGATAYLNLHAAMKRPLANIMYASGLFSSGTVSLGVNTLAQIVDGLAANGVSNSKLLALPGHDHVTEGELLMALPPTEGANLFRTRLGEFQLFYKDIASFHKPPARSDAMVGLTICFSGFRDSNLVDKIRNQGGIYSDSLSAKTTHLVVRTEPHPSKLKKAQGYGTKIIKVESLMEMLRNPESDGTAIQPPKEKPFEDGKTLQKRLNKEYAKVAPKAVKQIAEVGKPSGVKPKVKPPLRARITAKLRRR